MTGGVAEALGLQGTGVQVGASGVMPVILLVEPVLPGMCFEDDHLLRLPQPLNSVNGPALAQIQHGPVLLLASRDPEQPVHADNQLKTGTIFVCSRATTTDSGEIVLNGFALESAAVGSVGIAEDKVLVAEVRVKEWAMGVAMQEGRIAQLAKAMGVSSPGNVVMWVAGFGLRASKLAQQDLGQMLQGGPDAVIAGIAALAELGPAKPPVTQGPSEKLIVAYERWLVPVLARQLVLSDLLEGGWMIDIDAKTLTLGTTVYALHLLGTTDPDETEFLWSWAPQGMRFADEVTAAGKALRQQDIPEFQQTLVQLRSIPRDVLLTVQSGLDGRPYYFGKGSTGPGVQCLLDLELEVNAFAMIRALTRLPMMGTVRNHEAAVRRGIEAIGLQSNDGSEGLRIRLTTGEEVLVVFDSQGRFVSAEGAVTKA